jgi:hypothetical protein
LIKEKQTKWRTERNQLYDKIEDLEKKLTALEETAAAKKQSESFATETEHAELNDLKSDRAELQERLLVTQRKNAELIEQNELVSTKFAELQEDYRLKEENKEQEIEDLKTKL